MKNFCLKSKINFVNVTLFLKTLSFFYQIKMEDLEASKVPLSREDHIGFHSLPSDREVSLVEALGRGGVASSAIVHSSEAA